MSALSRKRVIIAASNSFSRKSVEAVDLKYLQRYIDSLKVDPGPSQRDILSKETPHNFLAEPSNREVAEIIIEDFQRLNDISEDAPKILTRICQARHFHYEATNLQPKYQ
jgi:hypothetical protein